LFAKDEFLRRGGDGDHAVRQFAGWRDGRQDRGSTHAFDQRNLLRRRRAVVRQDASGHAARRPPHLRGEGHPAEVASGLLKTSELTASPKTSAGLSALKITTPRAPATPPH